MSLEELLLQLHDITTPVEPGWWPLAQIWWYLMGLLLFIFISVWFVRKKQASQRSYKLANQELAELRAIYSESKNKIQLLQALSIWLKRVALFTFPEQNLAGLTGQHWLEFLDQSAGNTQFTNGVGHVLGHTMYARDTNVDAEKLLGLCEQWLTKIKPQMAQQEFG